MKLILGFYDASPASSYDYEARGRRGRHSVFHLCGIHDPDEPALLRLIEEGANGGRALSLVPFAIRALYGIATPACVPTLKRAAFYPLADAKAGAFALLVHVAGKEEVGFYLDTLTNKRYPYKDGPLSALGRWGGPEAIDDFVRRAKGVLRKRDRGRKRARFELIHAVRLLARHPEDPRTTEFLGFLTDRWDRVVPHERWSIAELLLEANIAGVWAAEPVEPPLGPYDSV